MDKFLTIFAVSFFNQKKMKIKVFTLSQQIIETIAKTRSSFFRTVIATQLFLVLFLFDIGIEKVNNISTLSFLAFPINIAMKRVLNTLQRTQKIS